VRHVLKKVACEEVKVKLNDGMLLHVKTYNTHTPTFSLTHSLSLSLSLSLFDGDKMTAVAAEMSTH
jgi:hypothetical protein